MVGMKDVKLAGFAPAMEGENLDMVTSHEICTESVQPFDNYREMLKQLRPDVAIVSTRLDRIPWISMDAANAGCHLICEKPLALDHETLSELHRVVRDKGVRLMAMLSMRSLPAFMAARDVYRSGDIGEVVVVNGRKSYRWLDQPDWYASRDTYGGTIGWVGIHAFDVISYITGESFTRVAALQSNFGHRHLKECEDNAVLIFEMSGGTHGTVSVDYFRPKTAPTHGDDWIRVVGTKGIIEANASQEFCRVLQEGKDSFDVPLPGPARLFRDFFSCLMNGTAPDVIESESFMLTHVCLCARDAADSGSLVPINQPFGTTSSEKGSS